MAEESNWRYRLRGDPANWLLDADDNPSVAFWFLSDVVGRPEGAPTMLDLRERILFSPPVQEIFAAQSEVGCWGNPDLLDEPKHHATLWVLAHLAELGIPRTSRRARAACEFGLQHLYLSDSSLLGLFVHSLQYFNYQHDARLAPLLEAIAPDAANGNVSALWALADTPNDTYSGFVNRGAERVIDAIARPEYKLFGVYPSFDAHDILLALRLLAQLNRLTDERLRAAVEQLWARQGEGGRWPLEETYDTLGVALTDRGPTPSKWATLNALRVVTKT